MDVAAHLGTLAAVMVYVRRNIWSMLASLTPRAPAGASSRRLIGLLIIASLPVIVAGLALEIAGPDVLRLTIVVALANLVFALWLWWADKTDIRHDLTLTKEQMADSTGPITSSPYKLAGHVVPACVFYRTCPDFCPDTGGITQRGDHDDGTPARL